MDMEVAVDLVMGITDMVEDLEVSLLFGGGCCFSLIQKHFYIHLRLCKIYINYQSHFLGLRKHTWLLAHGKPLYGNLYGYFWDNHTPFFSLEWQCFLNFLKKQEFN